jgi:cell division protein ZapA
MSAKGSKTVDVEIFGAVYHVRGSDESEYLQELAGYVDRKMRELASQVKTVDSSRIAVLTALNLADELFQCRKGQEGERVQIKEKVAELTGKLNRALEG